jgi:fatty acid desaturase
VTASLHASDRSSAELDDELRKATRGGRGSDYAELSRRVKAAGLMERRRGFYLAVGLVDALALIGCWVAVVLIGDSWWQLVPAVLLAIVFGQLGFLGHDAGHGQIFATRSANRIVGLVAGNLGIGLGYSWWVGKHNRHHAHPNDPERDPDVRAGALVFQADRAPERTGFLRWLTAWQGSCSCPCCCWKGCSSRWPACRRCCGATPARAGGASWA